VSLKGWTITPGWGVGVSVGLSVGASQYNVAGPKGAKVNARFVGAGAGFSPVNGPKVQASWSLTSHPSVALGEIVFSELTTLLVTRKRMPMPMRDVFAGDGYILQLSGVLPNVLGGDPFAKGGGALQLLLFCTPGTSIIQVPQLVGEAVAALATGKLHSAQLRAFGSAAGSLSGIDTGSVSCMTGQWIPEWLLN